MLPKTNKSLEYIQVIEQEIIDIISTLNPNKAVDGNKLSPRLLLLTKHSICKPLTILFNKSLQECKFPNTWKSAIIMPLFKKKVKQIYRQILDQLPYRVVLVNLWKELYINRNIFLNANKLIYKLQSGFRKGHSTVNQLKDICYIYNHICQGLDCSQYACMICCDVSKAFDRVWLKGLLFF